MTRYVAHFPSGDRFKRSAEKRFTHGWFVRYQIEATGHIAEIYGFTTSPTLADDYISSYIKGMRKRRQCAILDVKVIQVEPAPEMD